ncbi:MAG: recombinase family protein [Pyrinomonadaceae bacterium]
MNNSTAKTIRIASYARVSTDEQRESGTIATQRNSIREYAKYKKLDITGHFEDEAVSGALPMYKRPHGERLWRAVENHEFDQLIIYKIDRLGRRIKYVLDFVDHCTAHGVAIIATEENLDLSSSIGRLMLSILAAFAENERDVFRERSMAGKRRKAESGRIISHAPYGYTITDDYRLELDPLRAPVIKLIFERYAAGNSLRTIVDHLTEVKAALPVKSKGKWRHDSVILFLRNPAYYGEYHHFRSRQMHDAKPLPGPRDPDRMITMPCPPVVTRTLWDQVQNMLVLNRTSGPASKKRTYLLRGLIKCGLCNMTYAGHAVTPKSYTTKAGELRNYPEHRYYGCGSETNRDTKYCGNILVRADDLEERVWTDVEDFIRNPKSVIEKLLKLQRERSRISTDTQGSINKIERLLQKVKKQKANIVMAIGNETLSLEDAASTIETLNQQIDQLGDERISLESRLSDDAFGNVLREITNAQELLTELSERISKGFSNEERSEIIRALVQQIIIMPLEESSNSGGNGGSGKIKRTPEATISYLFEKHVYSSSVDNTFKSSLR